MTTMKKNTNKKNWIAIVGVLLAILSIILSFIPAFTNYVLTVFLLSVFALFHDQYSKTQTILKNTEETSNQVSLDVKNHLRVIRLDTPGKTFNDYIIKRLDIISEIRNTSFNVSADDRDANIYFNKTDTLKVAPEFVKSNIDNGLIWHDVGDKYAKKRFKTWHDYFYPEEQVTSSMGEYKSKLINPRVPYPNFLIITYKDARQEVLFNWDLRLNGTQPSVLVSNEDDLIQFYSAQFNLLYNNATDDADNSK
ncbi:hypothetical protein G7081_00125 [Vagococcus coleopterorum]|uniref:Uncharacterized protein n=1 Tax=Vagococcus coleopterorum TaxID=2714946 RepID=A0A6G8AKW4_9ENTE|nr:hypothetical protein [Vagococcus coleopterorum]QIL45602.1 hypothetical protein G7081_00125 [Vagococcus coleopterorum]